MLKQKKALIIGSGFSGSTSARILAENGYDVEILEKNSHIGGNMYDYKVDDINVHLYGPHIFHTSIDEVFDFLSKYTEWFEYRHTVKAKINGVLVPVPFNLTSLELLYPQAQAIYIKDKLISLVGMEKKVPIVELKKHSDPIIREFADFVYRNIFEFYTTKQWGRKISDLDESIFSRVPVSVSYSDGYFSDKYQFMPKYGYDMIFQNMLDHKNIEIKLNINANKNIEIKDNLVFYNGKPYDGEVIYTGCIDELLDYKFGALPYRTLKFNTIAIDEPSFQANSVINYTVDEDYTRISEYKKFTTPQSTSPKTVITYEYPKEFEANSGQIPYYPLPTMEARNLYEKYNLAISDVKNFHLLGRLANYIYINMDVAVANAMKVVEKILKKTL